MCGRPSNRPRWPGLHSKILPTFCLPGRPLQELGGVIVHYVSGKPEYPVDPFNLHVIRDVMLDLNLPRSARKHYLREPKWPDARMYASCHVLIGRDGEVWKLVEFDQEAFHAGASLLNGRRDCNRWTLGVELAGNRVSGFTLAQYGALAMLLFQLMRDHDLKRENVAGHDAVRWAAIQAGATTKRPKYDPSGARDGTGDNFDWGYLDRLLPG